MDVTVRYLVGARERRHWASELQLAIAVELARPEHAGRIVGAYPTTRVELRRAPSRATMRGHDGSHEDRVDSRA